MSIKRVNFSSQSLAPFQKPWGNRALKIAQKIATQIQSFDHRGIAHFEIVHALNKVGEVEKGKEIASQIESKKWRGEALALFRDVEEVAVGGVSYEELMIAYFARIMDFEEEEEEVEPTVDEVLTEEVKKSIQAGELKKGGLVLNLIQDPSFRDMSLRRLSNAYAHRGRFMKALSLAQKVGSLSVRVRALLDIFKASREGKTPSVSHNQEGVL